MLFKILKNIFLFGLLCNSLLVKASNKEIVERFLKEKIDITQDYSCRTVFHIPYISDDITIKNIFLLPQDNLSEYKLVVKFANSNQIFAKNIKVQITQICNYPVLLNRKDKGEFITKDDISFMEAPFKKTGDYILNPEFIYDHEAKYTIPPGKLIKVSDVQLPKLIKKNQSVMIVYNKGALSLKVDGIALEEGKKGAFIKVKNNKTNVVMTGEILDSNTVVIKK